jgi:prephenate dehydrogenase
LASNGSSGRERSRLLVVGAVDGIGRWFVEHVLVEEPSLQLTLADIDRRVLDLAETLTAQSGDVVTARILTYPEEGRVEGVDLGSFDAILLAVPIERMEQVARQIVAFARPGCLVLDVASLKVEPLAHLLEAAPSGVSVLGTHPVFGPRVPQLSGETVVLCETETTHPRHLQAVEALIRRHEGNTERLTPAEHDELMAVIQGLAHFVHLALGETFRTADLDVKGTLRVQTPPYHSIASVLGRLMNLSGQRQARLYAEIQEASGAGRLRKLFLGAATRLDQTFESGDPRAASEAIEAIARHFPPSTVEHFAAQSDEAVHLRQKQEIELRKLIRSGEVCGFRDRGGDVKVGVLVDLDQTDLVLRGEIFHGKGKVAAIYDSESQAAAALNGVSGVAREHRLSRRNYRPLTASELRHWRETELDPHSLHVTVGLPPLVNAAALAPYLVELIPDLLSAEFGDAYQPEDAALRQVTLQLRCIGDRRPSRVRAAIAGFVQVIGGEPPRDPATADPSLAPV